MRETKRLFHFTSAEYALQNIERSRIKVSEFDKVNDPYEFLAAKFDNSSQQHMFRNVRHAIGQCVGFISFSEYFNNTMLWGQYSDKAQGICLGFDIQSYNIDINLLHHFWIDSYNYLSPMIYSDVVSDMIDFNEDGSGSIAKSNLFQLMFTKSQDWRYEKEWRLYVRKPEADPANSELCFLPFGRQIILREILIGPRCQDASIERQMETLIADGKYPDPKPEIFRTSLSRSSFAIEKVT